MNKMEKVFSVIAFCLNKIERERDWLPFYDLVLNMVPHKGQLEFLRNSVQRENLLHPGNGFGKTEVLAGKHIYFILKHFADGADYKTLNIAITTDQASLVLDRMVKFISNSPLLNFWLFADSKNPITKFPYPVIKYCNGAQTEGRTTKRKAEAVEGMEFGYITPDEVALEMHLEFIRDKILLPRLRAWKDSQMDFSATPKGLNAYYRVCQDIKRRGGYVRGGSSYENPHIDHKLLDYQKKTWSQAKIDQIILGKFIDTAEMMFASRVEKLFSDEFDFDEVVTGSKYIEGWDLARGRKGSISDQTVGFRIDKTKVPYHIVKRWGFQIPWTEAERDNINAAEKMEKEKSSMEREIRNAHYDSQADVYLDSTGLGDTLYGMLMDIASPVDFRGGRKDIILDNLQAVIDAGLIKSPFIPELADEMTVYQRNDTLLDTDNLMALAIACSPIEIIKSNIKTIEG